MNLNPPPNPIAQTILLEVLPTHAFPLPTIVENMIQNIHRFFRIIYNFLKAEDSGTYFQSPIFALYSKKGEIILTMVSRETDLH